ncbi:hypothetical protein ACDT12_13155 [Staphylococcus aureus]
MTTKLLNELNRRELIFELQTREQDTTGTTRILSERLRKWFQVNEPDTELDYLEFDSEGWRQQEKEKEERRQDTKQINSKMEQMNGKMDNNMEQMKSNIEEMNIKMDGKIEQLVNKVEKRVDRSIPKNRDVHLRCVPGN